MGNKYEKEAKKAREAYERHRMCERKHGFDTPGEAEKPGVRVYLCPHCGKFHQTSSITGEY